MPNTTITFYKNVPLDMGYQHHLYATNATEYASALSGYAVTTQQNQSYQRLNRTLEVNVSRETLETCNYVMIQNQGEMKYYCFITDVQYISPTNTAVYYTVDLIGTYLNQNYVTINDSYVSRCHSYTDNVGDNTVPEENSGGFYIKNSVTQSNIGTADFYIIAASAYDLNEYHKDTWGEIIGGLYQGVNYYTFDKNDYTELNEALAAANSDNQLDSIVNLFQFPKNMWTISNDNPGVTVNITVPNNYSTLDGYTPINKKLYTYPYRYLDVDNSEGENLIFRYEEFDTPNNIVFQVRSVIDTMPSIICRAMSYCGENPYSPRCMLEMNNFPVCSFVNDAYKSWYAMNANQIRANRIQNVLAIGATVATAGIGGLVGAGLGAVAMSAINSNPAVSTSSILPSDYGKTLSNTVGNIAQNVMNPIGNLIAQEAQIKDMENAPNTVRGTGSIDAPFVSGDKDFRFKEMCWRRTLLEIQDQYFTVFGYAQKKIMTVSRHNRSKCTYVKTIGCNVSGNAPASVISQISTIFDNGITFWSSFSNFFDYSNNTPLG